MSKSKKTKKVKRPQAVAAWSALKPSWQQVLETLGINDDTYELFSEFRDAWIERNAKANPDLEVFRDFEVLNNASLFAAFAVKAINQLQAKHERLSRSLRDSFVQVMIETWDAASNTSEWIERQQIRNRGAKGNESKQKRMTDRIRKAREMYFTRDMSVAEIVEHFRKHEGMPRCSRDSVYRWVNDHQR